MSGYRQPARGARSSEGPFSYYERYGAALRRKCERMLGSSEDAEDVVQAVFADLAAKGPEEVDLGYLFRAATTRALNGLRDRRRRQRLLDAHGELLAPAHWGMEQRVASHRTLLRLAASLDPVTAEILVYRYFDDLGQEEIAALVCLSRKTVGVRLQEVRDALAALEES